MRQYIAGLSVDVLQPERNKFRPILLMIHDLWVGGWCWHDWATRFCNLGWECWAVSLRGRDPAKGVEEAKGQTFDDCIRDLHELSAALTSPMIVLAHGFGASLALTAYTRTAVAGILLAPACTAPRGTDESRTLRLLHLKYLPLIFLRQAILIRATDFLTLWLNCVGETYRREVLQGLVPESPQLVRGSFQRAKNFPVADASCPILVVGGSEDRLVANSSFKTLAANLGGEYHQYPHRGHWMLHEHDWETVVNDVHRWILNVMGESILITEQ